MIVLRPDEVRFGGAVWEKVARVTIDRLSVGTVDDWDELGPHLSFVDVGKQRAVIRVSQEIEGDDLDGPIPGDLSLLSFYTSNGTDVDRRRVYCDAVVESVMNRVSDYGSSRVITLIAVSSDGSVDPITVSTG